MVNVKEIHRGREALLEKQLKWTVRSSHAILENMETLIEIKQAIKDEDLTYVKQLWDELDLETQKDLIRAHRYGGAFPRAERAIISQLWKSNEGI